MCFLKMTFLTTLPLLSHSEENVDEPSFHNMFKMLIDVGRKT